MTTVQIMNRAFAMLDNQKKHIKALPCGPDKDVLLKFMRDISSNLNHFVELEKERELNDRDRQTQDPAQGQG